ncbi:MAG: hypothetical protein K5829_00355 [Treponema sp.]|nr:hypothetical protein [Treponema sp.]
MNTIPLTFDEHQINRTVIGGRQNDSLDCLNISVILLNSSGSHFKLQLFENLLSCNFHSIISIENDASNFSIDDVSKRFPSVKFIIPLEKASDGEMINIAMSEIQTDYVLVLRDSLYIPAGLILPHLADRLLENDPFCIAPRLMDKNKSAVTMQCSPSAEKSHFVIDRSKLVTDMMNTLYPYDYIALYNRKKFIRLGGFDYTIKSPYWQLLDFSIRAWLWGEKINLSTILQLSYLDEIPVEDKTVNLDYIRYYLKNEVPVYKNEAACIPSFSFVKFLVRSSCGFFEARRQFTDARNWVNKNRVKFKMDLPTLVQDWVTLE